jgi:hypothetical protein
VSIKGCSRVFFASVDYPRLGVGFSRGSVVLYATHCILTSEGIKVIQSCKGLDEVSSAVV